MTPGPAHHRGLRRPYARLRGPSGSSTLPAPDWGAQGTERTEAKKRRQHRCEGGDVGENLVPREPKGPPLHLQDDRKYDGGPREGQLLTARRMARAPPLPRASDEIREPDDDGDRGHQALRLAHRVRGLLHDHNDPDRAVPLFLSRMRITTGRPWRLKRPPRDQGRGVTLSLGSGRKGRSWNDVRQNGHRPVVDTRTSGKDPTRTSDVMVFGR